MIAYDARTARKHIAENKLDPTHTVVPMFEEHLQGLGGATIIRADGWERNPLSRHPLIHGFATVGGFTP